MNGKASLAAFLGLALWGANAYRYNQTTPFISSSGSFNLSQWKTIGIGLGGVVVGTFVANVSDDAANLVLAAFVILWVLFLIHATAKGSTKTTKSTSLKPASSGKVSIV